MDVQLAAPLRIDPSASTPLTVDEAHAELSKFLQQYQSRAHQSAGETTLASAQLEKLAIALAKEQSAAVEKTKR